MSFVHLNASWIILLSSFMNNKAHRPGKEHFHIRSLTFVYFYSFSFKKKYFIRHNSMLRGLSKYMLFNKFVNNICVNVKDDQNNKKILKYYICYKVLLLYHLKLKVAVCQQVK